MKNTVASILPWSIVFALLSGCARAHDPGPSSPPATPVALPQSTPAPIATPSSLPVTPTLSPSPSPTPTPQATLPSTRRPVRPRPKPRPAHPVKPHAAALDESYFKAALWPENATTKAWTITTVDEIRKNLSVLQQAEDIDDFCPNYQNASERLREICWLRIVSAVAQHESSFDPTSTFREPEGELSVGLLQMSAGECEFADRPVNDDDLKNPLINLECGVQKLARLIQLDQMIDGPFFARGASQYWSTLRSPYDFLGLHLGKKSAVIEASETYAQY